MTETETLRGIAVYNPDLLSKDELVAHFVARRPLLERLVDDLRRSTRSGNNQQHLIVGQRGMGKTMLLRRLRYAVEDDEELRRTWLPLTFPEEQYNVARLSDFYMNCADAVGDALEADGRRDDAHTLDAALDDVHALEEGARVRAALQLLLASADRLGKRLLLLVDNVELILDRLKDDQWAIRELLSAEKRLMLVGASAEAIEATYDYGAAFYDFFRVHELRGLTEVETREILRSLARLHKAAEVERILDEDPARVRALHVLTGGNPRTSVLLYGILAGGGGGDVRSDLERLLDLCTPLYKARFESLPAQSQQVVDLLALHWDPIRAGDLAELARLDVNVVSSQLNRLAQQGLVEKVAYHPSTKTGFQIAERFFNIWYLMRASRRIRQRLLWLVQFLRLMYGADELGLRAHAHLTHASTADGVTTVRRAEFGLALAQVIDDTPLRRALESDAIQGMFAVRELRQRLNSIIDLEGADAELKPHVDGAQWAAELRETVLSARVAWEGWDAERFALLLGGAPFLRHAAKMALASHFVAAGRPAVEGLQAALQALYDGFASLMGEPVVRALYHTVADGEMTCASDMDGAAAAAVKRSAPALVAATVVFALADAPRPDVVHIAAVLRRTTCPDKPFALAWMMLGRHLAKHVTDGGGEQAEEAARKAVELDPTSLPAVHTLALILAAGGKWAEAAPLAARFIQEGSDDFHERTWIDTVGVFREAVRTGHAAEAVKLLDETNAGERWRPLREALHALAVGDPRVLLRVAPEVRQPAEELMRKLTAADNEPDAGIVAPAHALVAEATLRGASVVADAPTREWPGTARRAGKRKTRPASSRTAGQEPPAVRRLRR